MVVQYCVEGTKAEFEGRFEDARALYQLAWESASDDFEACVAAHYVARFQDSPQEKLRWNRAALDHANAADSRVESFYPSLYLNMGQSFELVGNIEEARRYYDLAASMGYPHAMENRPCRK